LGPSTTDHCWAYADIALADMLGGRSPPLTTLWPQNLKSISPKEVVQYREILHCHLRAHTIFIGLDRLAEINATDWTQADEDN
jgi:hypothetical protein